MRQLSDPGTEGRLGRDRDDLEIVRRPLCIAPALGCAVAGDDDGNERGATYA